MTGLQVASPTRSGQLQLDGGGVDAGPVEELLVHDGAGVVQGGTDDPATLKSALQSPFLSIHRSHTVSGTAHFCWKHPLLTFAHTSPSYSDPFIHSSFSPLSHIGSFYNGAIWQSCCQIAGKAGAPARAPHRAHGLAATAAQPLRAKLSLVQYSVRTNKSASPNLRERL